MSIEPGQVLNRRYVIVRPLGMGGMGSVYLARDLLQGHRPVALKLLRPDAVDAGTVALFKDEFRSMARLRHPNLADVHDFGTLAEDGRHFLTMDYVEGRELGSFTPAELIARFDSLAAQCLRALDYIHARRILHNDLKPQNILICAPFRVRLVDFGLARSTAGRAVEGTGVVRAGADEAGSGVLSGTVHYIAPERIVAGSVDARSDLYALGVVLYQTLTGALPHDGPDPGSIIRAILDGRPRSPRALNAAIPERVEAFIMALLARNPEARPASAAAALAILNAGSPAPQRLDTPETYASYATSGRFVGRDQELDDLVALAADHAQGSPDESRPRLVILSGPSGIGKSRLLRELRQRLQLAGTRCLTGACYEDGGAAFQGFADVLRQIAPEDLTPDQRTILARTFPAAALAPAAGPPAPPAAGGESARAEILPGLASCLDALGGGDGGLLLMENLHWLDGPGVDLLNYLVLRPRRSPWLVIGTARDSEGTADPQEPGELPPSAGALIQRISRLARVRTMPLRSLSRDEVAELLESMVPFGERPERLAGVLAARTGGNPLYIEELVASFAEDGTLRRRGNSWTVAADSLDAGKIPASLLAAMARRLEALDAPARGLAEILAVFNRPVAAHLASRALGMDPAPTLAAGETLESLRLATVDPQPAGPPLLGLAHNRLREVIYEAVPDSRRRALHLAAGTALEEEHRTAPAVIVEELAHHFSKAADHDRAARYCLQAAARAEALDNPASQVTFLHRALEHLPEQDHDRRMTALRDLTYLETYALGYFEAGLRDSQALVALARRRGDPAMETRGLIGHSRSLSYQGDPGEAVRLGEQATEITRKLQDLDLRATAINNLGILHARQGQNERAMECFLEASQISVQIGAVDLQGLVMGNLSINYLGLGQPDKALEAIQGVLKLRYEGGWLTDYYRGRANEGMILQENGRLALGLEVLDNTLQWSREHVSLEIQGQTLHNIANFESLRGRFDRAARLAEEELEHRGEIEDVSRKVMALDLLATIERQLGRLDRAEPLRTEALAIARSRGLRGQEGYVLAARAADRLAAGSLNEADAAAKEALAIGRELSHPRITFQARCIEARTAALRGERRAVVRAIRTVTRLNLRALRFYDRIQMHLDLGQCFLQIDRPVDTAREARAGLALALPGGYREHTWRLHAILAEAFEAQGLREEANASYNDARTLIRQIASEYEDDAMKDTYLAESRRRAILRGGEQELAAPAASASAAGASAPGAPALGASTAAVGATGRDPVQMLETVYEITQVINSILDPRELLNKVMDLAIDMVGAERGLIFLYRPETDEMDMVVARNLEHQTIQDATQYSRGILREVGRGRPVLSVDALADSRFKEYQSVSIYQIRSLLCVPLRMKDRIVGTVYVDTRRPGRVFTEDDQRFLEVFANQAAVAIENARLFDQVRQENTWLKAAVNERYGYENIIGRSPKMRAVFQLLGRIAPSSLPVLIQGESGTGKELVARALHHNSPRRDRRFFTENCAALPDTLLESELFGHVKGAFTGADAPRKGLFELADGGTLFLDEVGDMSPAMQSKLLRVLQDGEIRPVGSEVTRRVDVRLVSATNRDLQAMMREKKFREDLFYRLNVVTVRIPSLRERRDDIPLLVDHFLVRLAEKNKSPRLRIDGALLADLMRYDWPGNVRELENQVYRLALFAGGETLTLTDARHDAEFMTRMAGPGSGAGGRGAGGGSLTADDLQRALSQAGGNRDEAARILGVSRATFFRRQKEFKIADRPRPSPPPQPDQA